jgi:hypothetical protein
MDRVPDVPLTPDVRVVATLATSAVPIAHAARFGCLIPQGDLTVEFAALDYYDRGLAEPMLIVSGRWQHGEQAAGQGTATLGAAMFERPARRHARD